MRLLAKSDPGGGETRDPHPWPLLSWVAVWGFWTAFGILLAAPRVLLPGGETAGSWTEALRLALLDMYSWGAVGLVAVSLAGQIPLLQRQWPRVLALHIGTGIVVLSLRFWMANGLAYLVEWIPQMPPAMIFLHVLPWNLLFYLSMVAGGYALDYYRRYRDRELEASRLELQASQLELAASVLQAQLAQAQLQTLKMQLHPHFLFNTLHAISGLIHDDPDRAESMITYLGDLLRAALSYRQQQEVTLGEEVRLLEPYLEIEKTRFGDRLAVDVSLEPGTLDARVPHLILQPLIENSIKHGLAPRREPGRIQLRARRQNGTLRVQVRDNGRGLRNGTRRPDGSDGVGLANTRARLERLYGTEHEFRIDNHPDGGVEVEFVIPFQTEPREPALASAAQAG